MDLLAAPLIAIVLVLAVVVIPLAAALISYNRFVAQRALIESSWSGVDVELTRRHELVPNLVATVRGYAAHEREVLDQVVAARERALPMEGAGPDARTGAENDMTRALAGLMVRAEAYPDLRSSENFLQLQKALAQTEDRIAAARRFFNNNVAAYNTRVATVPANLVAALGGFTRHEQFRLADPTLASNPRIDL